MGEVSGWTFGAELELSDWPRTEPLPLQGQGIDVRDVTMVNSCGVAVDPRGELFRLGGEIQTAPTSTPEGQGEQLADIMRRWPQTTVNYRSNLHVHVRVPGLRENLEQLKRVQLYVHRWMLVVLPIIEPIPGPGRPPGVTTTSAWDLADYQGARKRAARRRVSHQKLLSKTRIMWQMSADTPEEFRDREYKNPQTGGLHPAIHPRACVNLRQLWETDTIEFRHFPGTTSPEKLYHAVLWCRHFLECALDDGGDEIARLAHVYAREKLLPTFCPYDHWLETGYESTSLKHHNRRDLPSLIRAWVTTQHVMIEKRGAPL